MTFAGTARPPRGSTLPPPPRLPGGSRAPRKSDIHNRCEELLAKLRARTGMMLFTARELRWMLHRTLELLTPTQQRILVRRVEAHAKALRKERGSK